MIYRHLIVLAVAGLSSACVTTADPNAYRTALVSESRIVIGAERLLETRNNYREGLKRHQQLLRGMNPEGPLELRVKLSMCDGAPVVYDEGEIDYDEEFKIEGEQLEQLVTRCAGKLQLREKLPEAQLDIAFALKGAPKGTPVAAVTPYYFLDPKPRAAEIYDTWISRLVQPIKEKERDARQDAVEYASSEAGLKESGCALSVQVAEIEAMLSKERAVVKTSGVITKERARKLDVYAQGLVDRQDSLKRTTTAYREKTGRDLDLGACPTGGTPAH